LVRPKGHRLSQCQRAPTKFRNHAYLAEAVVASQPTAAVARRSVEVGYGASATKGWLSITQPLYLHEQSWHAQIEPFRVGPTAVSLGGWTIVASKLDWRD